ncbi:hypothetical protein ACHAW6_011442 [Cyclotella cf. meneghiniana]
MKIIAAIAVLAATSALALVEPYVSPPKKSSLSAVFSRRDALLTAARFSGLTLGSIMAPGVATPFFVGKIKRCSCGKFVWSRNTWHLMYTPKCELSILLERLQASQLDVSVCCNHITRDLQKRRRSTQRMIIQHSKSIRAEEQIN